MATIENNLGTIGNYEVSEQIISSKFYVLMEEKQDDGTVKKISVPIRRCRRNIVLVHVKTKDVVSFSTYMARGEKRFKDSRNKTSNPTPTKMLDGIQQVLGIDTDKAKQLMEIGQ